MKFCFGGGPRKTAHSVRNPIIFVLISYRVVFTWYFITWIEIWFLSKWPQWNNTRNKFYFGLYHLNSYEKLTRNRNENVISPERKSHVNNFLMAHVDVTYWFGKWEISQNSGIKHPILLKKICFPSNFAILSVFSPNAGKCEPEKLWIRTLCTQWPAIPTKQGRA